MSQHLSVGDRWRLTSLKFDQGLNVHQIARIISCNIRTVYRILELFQETNNVIQRNGRCRQLMLNDGRLPT
ncbi:unnamed protein product, partial [Rotaria sp. Silwood2]